MINTHFFKSNLFEFFDEYFAHFIFFLDDLKGEKNGGSELNAEYVANFFQRPSYDLYLMKFGTSNHNFNF